MESVTNGAGRTVFVRSDDGRGRALLASAGDLNPPSLALWAKLCAVAPWDVVVDVGANYGEMLLAHPLPLGARILALEPAPRVAACLRASLERAGLDVEVLEAAAGSRSGPGTLFIDPSWSGTTTLTPEHSREGAAATPVTVVRLDEVLGARGLRPGSRLLVKIDVEGGERDTLEGLGALGELADVVIQVEILHASDEDLDWMLALYVVHVVALDGSGLVPVATRDRLAEELSSGRAYGQDVVLSARVLAPNWGAPADERVTRVTRYAAELREEIARRSDPRGAATLDSAVARVRRDYESSRSWRLTRPGRALATALRRRGRRPRRVR